jgi:hypothetical protein
MRAFAIWIILGTLCGGPRWACAQLNLVAGQEPQRVFAGDGRLIHVLWHNSGSTASETDIQTRLMQLTSATAVSVAAAPWKRLQVLPGQTVVETAEFNLPAVNAATRFLVQWIQDSNHVLGQTEIEVYPTNLLAELQDVVGKGNTLGVFDPHDELKSLLDDAKVDFVDLGNTVLENFRGKLAIIGPFESKVPMDATFAAEIRTLAKKGVALVWVQAPRGDSSKPENDKIQPSFYSVPEDKVATVVVQPEMVRNLAGNPRSQINLIHFCKLALHPQPPVLPGLSLQP